MSGILDDLLEEYRTLLERHRNRPFLKAAMAACALAACASGEVRFRDRIRVDQILETLERLNVFDPHEGVELFNSYAEEILRSPRSGHDKALAAVRAATKDESSAALLVKICLAVAEAGGDRSLSQEIEVVMLCSVLGVDSRVLGLYREGELPGGDGRPG